MYITSEIRCRRLLRFKALDTKYIFIQELKKDDQNPEETKRARVLKSGIFGNEVHVSQYLSEISNNMVSFKLIQTIYIAVKKDIFCAKNHFFQS